MDHAKAKTSLTMKNYHLPPDYVSRPQPDYFGDHKIFDSEVIYQPEVYDAADYLAVAAGRTTVIDVGCGSGRKLRDVRAERRIGIDFGENIAFCRKRHADWGEWLDADLSQPSVVCLTQLANEKSIVICADVIEDLPDPTPLLALLAGCHARGAIVLTSTPDRMRVYGYDHRGPPENASRVREWTLDEYVAVLFEAGLPPVFSGYTLNNNVNRQLRTIVTIHDPSIDAALCNRQELARPVAIIAAFNEEDVICETTSDLLAQGCDVVALDNWSTDRTWQRLQNLAAQNPASVRVERFPESAALFHEWEQILRRKQQIAAEFPGRWVLHVDADEVRHSPFSRMTLADALGTAQRCGFNRVNFNLINFRPVDQRLFAGATLRDHFDHFEYGTRPGHFMQKKAWLQGSSCVDLASSGGHVANFANAHDFPYRFLMKHYPIRSQEHGVRKVIQERRTLWSPRERSELGWHVQYDQYTANSNFTWRVTDLHRYDENFWREHGLVIMTDIAERRLQHAARAVPGSASSLTR